MSLLINHTLTEATAIFRGERHSHIWQDTFPLDSLETWRLNGLVAAPGHAELDSDMAWESVVRSWWGLGITWGLGVVGNADGISWNLILPDQGFGAQQAAAIHLTGARMERDADFKSFSQKIHSHPFRASMAGHSGAGPAARLEPALRALLGHDFMILVLAKALRRSTLESELRRLSGEEQFVRDEHLSRAGLEKDSHSSATRYLDMVGAARERASAASQEGGWLARTVVAACNQQVFNQIFSLIHGCYSADGGEPEPLRWQSTCDPRKLTFLRSKEVAALTRPPRREMPGFIVETSIRETHGSNAVSPSAIFSTAPSSGIAGGTIAFGRILDDSGNPGAWLEIGINELCRHLLVAGMTGSGKSITCEHILLELWREHRIPWLVIEPGLKSGYRHMKNSEIGTDLDVWAIGDPKSRRLALNPMAVPPGVGLAEHTTALFTVLSSAFELVAPMPEVLAAAIEETYRNHGWSLAELTPAGPPPTLADLVNEIDRSAPRLGYGSEITGNIRAGLLLRMRRLLEGPLAPELSSPCGLDVGSLVRSPVIIELSALSDGPSQAMVMGLIALQLRHYWRLAGQSNSLRYVLLIEEAHRLLKAVPGTSPNASRTQAVESLANMLAEMRGLGVGMVVVDQTPSALVPSVIANTGTKILHRLDHPADRELAGRAAGLPAGQVDLLGTLPVGDAILRSDRRARPFRLRMPNPAITYGNMPLPSLPDGQTRLSRACCPVCGESECKAAKQGAKGDNISRRLAAFLRIMESSRRDSLDEASRWAATELQTAGFGPAPDRKRLCFLIALAQAARLSPETIRRIWAAFQSGLD